MPKFFCDYCDVYLTHDSMSVRKAHNNGRNHLRNVQAYYEQISSEQTQQVINSITDAYNTEGQANPLFQQNLSGGYPGGPMAMAGGMGMGGPPMGMPGPMPGMPPFMPPGEDPVAGALADAVQDSPDTDTIMQGCHQSQECHPNSWVEAAVSPSFSNLFLEDQHANTNAAPNMPTNMPPFPGGPHGMPPGGPGGMPGNMPPFPPPHMAGGAPAGMPFPFPPPGNAGSPPAGLPFAPPAGGQSTPFFNDANPAGLPPTRPPRNNSAAAEFTDRKRKRDIEIDTPAMRIRGGGGTGAGPGAAAATGANAIVPKRMKA
ncbi:hypothetical protein J1614_001356 [Plenodomus biglobosus]|nr:hypothetical protein J1614_001356 [Plenodomus biglobosus]